MVGWGGEEVRDGLWKGNESVWVWIGLFLALCEWVA